MHSNKQLINGSLTESVKIHSGVKFLKAMWIKAASSDERALAVQVRGGMLPSGCAT